MLMWNREFAAAHSALQRALEIQPESDYTLYSLGMLELLDGQAVQALATFRSVRDEAFRLQGIALTEGALGHDQESQQALNELIAKDAEQAPCEIAQVYAFRGAKDAAFEWLDRAYQQHDSDLTTIKADLMLVQLRSDARFAAMVAKMRLPE
jgi:serine/threonine-protein kinase